MQAALLERGRIIQDLTDSLKHSNEIRDKLSEQNEALLNELKQLRETNEPSNWIADRNFDLGEKRLSQTTIDLVAESDFEDDDFFKKTKLPTQEIDAPSENVQQSNRIDGDKTLNPTIEEFKESLNENELQIFAKIEGKFEMMLNAKVNAIREQLQQEQLDKAVLESETNRLKQLLVNVKGGSTELAELRAELDAIHKKEMENLRLYFEKKCTDLEKQ